MYAERNVCVVPNTIVKKILGSEGVEPVEGDAFHYKHTYPDRATFVKALYGFKDWELFDEISKYVMYYVENLGEYDNYEQFRDAANTFIDLSKKKGESLRLLLEQDEYYAKEILDLAIEFFVGLEEMHFTHSFNEFPEKTFEEAKFMFHVIEELGTPSQYDEAKELYKRWRSDVIPFVLLAPQL